MIKFSMSFIIQIKAKKNKTFIWKILKKTFKMNKKSNVITKKGDCIKWNQNILKRKKLLPRILFFEASDKEDYSGRVNEKRDL